MENKQSLATVLSFVISGALLIQNLAPTIASSGAPVLTSLGLWPKGAPSTGPSAVPGFGVVGNSSDDLETTQTIVVTPENTNDGTGDMTVKLQAALDYAQKTNSKVEMSPGLYQISSMLNCSFTEIHGQAPVGTWSTRPSKGTRISVNPKNSFSGAALLYLNDHCTVDGLILDATGSNGANAANISGWGNTVDHSQFMFGYHNVYFTNSGNTYWTGNQLRNSGFGMSTSDGITVDYGNANGYIHNCSIWGAGGSASGWGHGINFISSNAQWIITDNYIQQNMGDGLHISSGDFAWQMQINNNAFDANLQCALHSDGQLQYSTVVGNIFMATGYNALYKVYRSGTSHLCFGGGNVEGVSIGQNVYQAFSRDGEPRSPDYDYYVANGVAFLETTFYEKAATQNVGVYANGFSENLLLPLLH